MFDVAKTAKPKLYTALKHLTEREMMRKFSIILTAIVMTYTIPAEADRLVCSQLEHLRYMKMVGQVGEMGIELNPVGQDRATFERLIAAYESLDPKGPKTSLFVAYVPTGQIYSKVCAQERCTMEEMAAPEQSCLIDHMNQCSYVALRFRGEEFCLLRSPQN
ncbi:hypothetical protein QBD00_002240 [Ochrobactrum sp. AN78]|nr:hypothetical protein [Ochrobactrum sp. AN78]